MASWSDRLSHMAKTVQQAVAENVLDDDPSDNAKTHKPISDHQEKLKLELIRLDSIVQEKDERIIHLENTNRELLIISTKLNQAVAYIRKLTQENERLTNLPKEKGSNFGEMQDETVHHLNDQIVVLQEKLDMAEKEIQKYTNNKHLGENNDDIVSLLNEQIANLEINFVKVKDEAKSTENEKNTLKEQYSILQQEIKKEEVKSKDLNIQIFKLKESLKVVGHEFESYKIDSDTKKQITTDLEHERVADSKANNLDEIHKLTENLKAVKNEFEIYKMESDSKYETVSHSLKQTRLLAAEKIKKLKTDNDELLGKVVDDTQVQPLLDKVRTLENAIEETDSLKTKYLTLVEHNPTYRRVQIPLKLGYAL
jgi:chromosome segregation ATPase